MTLRTTGKLQIRKYLGGFQILRKHCRGDGEFVKCLCFLTWGRGVQPNAYVSKKMNKLLKLHVIKTRPLIMKET